MSAQFQLFAQRLEESLRFRAKAAMNDQVASAIFEVLNAVTEARALPTLERLTFCRAIKEAREARGLSLADAAEAANMSKAHLWDLERGDAQNPSLNTMRTLNAVLGLKPEDWFR